MPSSIGPSSIYPFLYTLPTALLLMQLFPLTLAYSPPTIFLPCRENLLLFLFHRSSLLAFLPRPLLILPLLIRSGFFNRRQKVFMPKELNFFTFASMNQTSTLLHLSRFIDTLFCYLIAITPGLAPLLLMTCTLIISVR